MESTEIEISLEDIFLLLWKNLRVLLVCLILGGLLAGGVTYFKVKPTYTASASLYVSNQQASQEKTLSMSDLNVSQSLVATYLVIIESDTVLDKVAAQISKEAAVVAEKPLAAKDIRKMLTSGAMNNTEAFQVSITNSDPALAQKIVEAILQIAPKEIIRVVKAGAVEVIDRPVQPTEARWPIYRNIAVGAMIGFILSAGYVFVKKLLDTTVHSERDLAAAFDLPVLGVIPQFEQNAHKSGGGSRK